MLTAQTVAWLGVLWALASGRWKKSAHAFQAATTSKPKPSTSTSHRPGNPPAPASTPPWPSQVPKDLPSFPGSGWEPDTPVRPAVAARAQVLLSQLGPGQYRLEPVEGRWLAFQCQQTGTRKVVVAWRPVPGAAPAPTPTAKPAATPSPTAGRPTLRAGSRGPDVAYVQRKLGLTADGIYGTQTLVAVKQFQRTNGLEVDGIVGPKTWGVLG